MEKRKKWLVIMMIFALVIVVTIPTTVNASEDSLNTNQSERNQILGTRKNLNSVDAIFTEQTSIPMTDVINAEDVITDSEGYRPQARAGIATKYGWGSGTAPYDFTQKWSTNKEVYSSYPYYNDGFLYPATTVMLNNPSYSSYDTALRQGYVNDSWGSQIGLHAYYHTVSSDKLNSITVILDKNVTFQVYDMNFNPVLNTDSPAYNNLLLYYKITVSVSGGVKDVHTLKLKNGNYYIVFAPASGTGNSHYGLFTGNPLPIQQSHIVNTSTHNGSIKWDGYSSYQTYQCPPASVSISNGAELFALKRVTFKDFTPSINNAYVKSVDMMYQSPNSYSYKTVATMAGLGNDMIDNYPDSGSMVGTYNTKVQVNWGPISYVNASYFTLTMLTIDYLVPLGEVNVSF